MHYLYYAGMANDIINEQIGLAVSSDGKNFARANKNGLIIKRDERILWKSLRVCNPTVLLQGSKFVMFYQGISKEGKNNVSIGVAYSKNGVDWECNDSPSISWESMSEPGARPDVREGLIEPAVLFEDGIYRMWFIHVNEQMPGNVVCFAESENGETWKIVSRKVLSGDQFGNFRIHYPQMMKRGKTYEMWFTLRNNRSKIFGIFKMRSIDGMNWNNLEQVLPNRDGRIDLERRDISPFAFGSSRLARKGVSFLNNRLPAILRQTNYYGFAHPHVIESGDHDVMYYHNDNIERRGMWLDIGRCEIRGGIIQNPKKVLEPSRDSREWDAYFVGDPFVLVV